METKEIVIEIPVNAAIVSLKCYDAVGSFFAESISIVAEDEEAQEEEDKKDVKNAKEALKDMKEEDKEVEKK